VEEKAGRGSGKGGQGGDKGKGIRGWWRRGHTTTKNNTHGSFNPI